MQKMTKKDIIRLLEDIGLYLEIQGENPFRISAYRKAAQSLEKDERSLAEIDDFSTIPGIGKGTNDLITEYMTIGKSSTLEQLQQDVPSGLIPLLKLPGLGGKRLATLYKELAITDAATLQAACEDGRVAELKGFGKKTVENILQALQEQSSRPERLPVSYMLKLAHNIEAQLEKIPDISRFSLAGSLRRMRETIKDIDFIIATDKPEPVKEALLQINDVKDVIAGGSTKVSVTLADEYDVNVDFRLVEDSAFTTTLHHFTGSKDHNVAMRQLAKQRGEKINEYGVEVEATNETLQFKTEKDFFAHFEVDFIPPEMREDMGEVTEFQQGYQPLERNMIRGDLHMHSTYSDGAESIEEMVQYARKLNYEYIAITDHSKFLQVANGLNETRLRKQGEEIAMLNEKYPDIHILAGVEMDILPNGELDFSDDFLQEMDLVIAAIHSSFNQSEADIMKRLEMATNNPYVDIIAHPTGRLIGRRDGYDVNVEKLIELAKKTDTVLELNANPMRFDLAPHWLQQAQEAGVTLAINTDAHRTTMLEHMAYGVQVANKGWINKSPVLNSWELNDLLTHLNRNK